MDSRTPPLEKAHSAHLPTGPGPGPDPRERPAPQGRKVLELGHAFVKTVRHFWPQLNPWLQALPDTRFEPMIDYDVRFLCWWGLSLFTLKLGSRRQLDFQLRDPELRVLENLNRLAGTQQETLPVNKTLSHFLGHVGSAALARLRTDCVRQLIRNKVLDSTRLQGSFTVAVDGTGFLSFKERHCPHCLVHKHESYTCYLHPVLEAKLVDTRGLALSLGSEFIENPSEPAQNPNLSTLTAYEAVKQDCELKAFARLAANLKEHFPQTRFCLGGDSLYACGPVFSTCARHHWSFVLTFKPGRTPALWQEFQSLLKLSPENRLLASLPDKTRQCFRWVNDLKHEDDQGRLHVVHALWCEESGPEGNQTFAWVTDFRLSQKNVCAVANQGGRVRCNIENQGFNIQKNSGLNLEHAYSTDPDVMKAFYYLLQIAHLFLQMFEMGSLLRRLAQEYATTPVGLFGSLKNMAQRLLDCFRYFQLGEAAFETGPCQIRLCDSG
jgi:hypothetical protein